MEPSRPSPAPPLLHTRPPARPRWWCLAVALGVAFTSLLVANASASDVRLPHGPLPRTAASAVTLRERATGPAAPTTTTTAPAPAVVTPPEDTTLLTPEDVPDPSVRRPIQIIGRIQIPKIRLDADLRDQITQESIDLGPSHWPGTAAPGGYGNVVIAGHRSSHSAPFHDLGVLQAGDAIVLVDTSGRSFTYSVTDQFVVEPDAMWITDQKPGHTLTLFTCHPIGSSAQRLVIRATLV
jgi:sortase A